MIVCFFVCLYPYTVVLPVYTVQYIGHTCKPVHLCTLYSTVTTHVSLFTVHPYPPIKYIIMFMLYFCHLDPSQTIQDKK